MSQSSRLNNSVKNIVVNVIVQFATLLVSFISRRIFNDILGIEYLGLSGLFSNILLVLSLTELGVSSAIMYNLYKPMAEENYIRVAKIINYYKKLYHIIGCSVLAIGLALIPVLKYIVNFEDVNLPNSTLYIYYLLLLLNSVLSYFFVYKTSVTIADQKGYKLKYFYIAFTFIQLGLQIAVLLVFKSYIGYILVQVICGFLQNIITSYYSQHKYPFIKSKAVLDKEDRKDILKQVKYMFSYQIGNVILNNTDNILISVLDSTKMVGLYSNYYSLINAVSSFASLVFTSIQSSIGNFLVKADSKRQYLMFRTLTLMSFIIYSVASIGIFELIDDVIRIWFGRTDYVLSKELLFTCIFNFYISGILYPIWSYRNTVGLFKQTKNVMFFTSAINLILSVILGKIYGVVGILLSTGISRIVTTVWYEPYVLFKVYFKLTKKDLIKYYIKQLFYAGEFVLLLIITNFVISKISIESFILTELVKILLSILIPLVFIVILHFRTVEFKNLCSYAKSIVNKAMRKIR